MEKLAGDFEEQIKALQSAIGRPWITADEGRGLMNMRSLGGDASELVTPLNVIVGGQASPTDSAPKDLQISHSEKHLGELNNKQFDSYAPGSTLKSPFLLARMTMRFSPLASSRIRATPVDASGSATTATRAWTAAESIEAGNS